MSRRDPGSAIAHMVQHAQEAIALAAGRNRHELDADRTLQLALTRLVEIVGEAASRVPESERKGNAAVPWRAIIGCAVVSSTATTLSSWMCSGMPSRAICPSCLQPFGPAHELRSTASASQAECRGWSSAAARPADRELRSRWRVTSPAFVDRRGLAWTGAVKRRHGHELRGGYVTRCRVGHGTTRGLEWTRVIGREHQSVQGVEAGRSA